MKTTLNDMKEQSRWLCRHACNVTSQFGEDGIIAKALSLLPERSSWCVEFGAWDGKYLSNTYDLVTAQNYRGVFIEADPVRFKDLEKTHGASGRNVLINAFVGFSANDSLDVLLSRCDIPGRFDVLSIDIDGNDYYAWEATEQYRPSIVVIEFNPTISNSSSFVQKKDHSIAQGCGPGALVDLGRLKGYELISVTPTNLVFVAAEYYEVFGIADNSLSVMRDDSDTPRIFVGYDGHVFLSHGKTAGSITIPWHGLKLDEANVQPLAGFLQKHPDHYNLAEKAIFWGLKRPRYTLQKMLSSRRGHS